MLKMKKIPLGLTFLLLIVLASCSGNTGTSHIQEVRAKQGGIDRSSPEYMQKRLRTILAGCFQEQVLYFYLHYGRVPSSYEEWRDSGFILFTPWTGHHTQPANHVEYSPSAENDPYGTFHYESFGDYKYKLEFVFSVEGPLKILTFGKDFKEPVHSIKTGYKYMEAKADACFSLLELLWIYKMEYPKEKPASLIDVVDGYISLVPEGFRIPEGVDSTGEFEFGFDFTDGCEYAVSNLSDWRFSKWFTKVDWGNKNEAIPGDNLVLFSSELLKAGYPGLFGE
jgi:hypothetical protein